MRSRCWHHRRWSRRSSRCQVRRKPRQRSPMMTHRNGADQRCAGGGGDGFYAFSGSAFCASGAFGAPAPSPSQPSQMAARGNPCDAALISTRSMNTTSSGGHGGAVLDARRVARAFHRAPPSSSRCSRAHRWWARSRSSMRPSRSTCEVQFHRLDHRPLAGSSCERSIELIDGRYARMRGDSRIRVLEITGQRFPARPHRCRRRGAACS